MRAAFDQDAGEALFGEGPKDRGRSDFATRGGDFDDLDARRKRWPYALSRDHQPASTVLGQDPGVGGQPPSWIEHDPGRAGPGDPAHGELWIVGDRRSNAYKYGIDQCAQPVQVRQAGRTVDVLGMPGHRRDPAIDRLPDLPDHHQLIHRTPPEGTEP